MIYNNTFEGGYNGNKKTSEKSLAFFLYIDIIFTILCIRIYCKIEVLNGKKI